ncbi:unnamed protein product [Effrenium voratum]|nr:unnamed protein product [Effrenium voratum]
MARQVKQKFCLRSIFSSGHWSIATTGTRASRTESLLPPACACEPARQASASMKGLINKKRANEEVGRTRDIKVELPTQESGYSQPVKRRRLWRHDVQVSQSMGAICKKEENKEAGLDLHNLWLKIKMEVKEEIEAMDGRNPEGGLQEAKTEPTDCKVKAEASFLTSTSGKDGKNIKGQPKVKVGKAQAADGKAAMVKAEPALEETGRQLTLPTGHSLADRSDLPNFEGQMTAWAHQCAEFRGKSTWTPSRPCCPAHLFFISPIVPEEKDLPCVQRLSQKELCCLRRFFERRHPIFAAPLPAADPTPKPLARAAAAASQEDKNFPARGAACMKMWPWMRDLPSGIWAGRGLAYDEQSGLRRLSSAGGAEAMHSVQVWESVGAAGQPAAQPPTAAKSAAATPGPAAAGGNVPGNALKPAKVLSKQQEKQSGVPGISWVSPQFTWKLRWTEKDEKGASTRQAQSFTISSFMKQGLNEVEAEAAALEAAKAFRADLVAKGCIKEKVRDESLTSDVPGVSFQKLKKKWLVQIVKPGSRNIHGGYFTEKAEAEARATELRELHGLQRTVKSCAARAELPVFQPKVAFPGVTWHARSQCWQADSKGTIRMQRTFKPLEHSELELEKAFAKAVAWLKKQRKEIQDGGGAGAKGKIDKKGRSKKG